KDLNAPPPGGLVIGLEVPRQLHESDRVRLKGVGCLRALRRIEQRRPDPGADVNVGRIPVEEMVEHLKSPWLPNVVLQSPPEINPVIEDDIELQPVLSYSLTVWAVWRCNFHFGAHDDDVNYSI